MRRIDHDRETSFLYEAQPCFHFLRDLLERNTKPGRLSPDLCDGPAMGLDEEVLRR